MTATFSGSYAASDVVFLLNRVQAPSMDVAEKEAFIKKGGHYSEVISWEKAPSPLYMGIYRQVLSANKARFACDVLHLSEAIWASMPCGVAPVVVSLARAGTPVGVLVARALRKTLQADVPHYCVSIIRDKGLDLNALQHIVDAHGAAGIRFIDGWTGKGVIGAELAKSVAAYNERTGSQVSSDLYVVSDIAGTAAYAATRDDYLLPSAVLNSTISGLVSRTVSLPGQDPRAFHGCLFYDQLNTVDVSREFVNEVWAEMLAQFFTSSAWWSRGPDKAVSRAALQSVVSRYMAAHALSSPNLVKPGLGEATRVLLRRKPLLLVVRQQLTTETAHLHYMAEEKGVPVTQDPTLPCKALALIDHAD